ncbi:MAG: CRISPR-associated protein, Csx11 family [Clostridia bacterium 62_21]|nr:MAG: CRISPR-associated protein, Csx11 family [Clostridia bacterium 62_21]
MDELADRNDRVALIVGTFGLEDWLSGDLVQTVLVKAAEAEPGKCVPKNPSPARLRRVWETTRRFWTETVEHLLKTIPDRRRWELVSQDRA